MWWGWTTRKIRIAMRRGVFEVGLTIAMTGVLTSSSPGSKRYNGAGSWRLLMRRRAPD